MSKTISEAGLYRKAVRASGKKLKARGKVKPGHATLPNHNSTWKTSEEEIAGRRQAVEETLIVFRQLLPGLLHDLSRIKDPRNPQKVKHKLTVLTLYGILAFVFQYASRREAGREMSRPVLYENLNALFPELESLPHQDTLYRLLERITISGPWLYHERIRELQGQKRNLRFTLYE